MKQGESALSALGLKTADIKTTEMSSLDDDAIQNNLASVTPIGVEPAATMTPGAADKGLAKEDTGSSLMPKKE